MTHGPARPFPALAILLMLGATLWWVCCQSDLPGRSGYASAGGSSPYHITPLGKDGRERSSQPRENAFWASGSIAQDRTVAPAESKPTLACRNASGQEVGSAPTAGPYRHAFLWEQGKPMDLGTLGGKSSWATHINAFGQVIGCSWTPSATVHAFLWQGHRMLDLGTLGGKSSWAYGINDYGQVVGAAETASGVVHAFLYTNARMYDLGALEGGDSSATSINNSGQIVGESEVAYPGVEQHAVVWQGGELIDLNRRLPSGCGWKVESARSIDETGKIHASAWYRDQHIYNVLLTPR